MRASGTLRESKANMASILPGTAEILSKKAVCRVSSRVSTSDSTSHGNSQQPA